MSGISYFELIMDNCTKWVYFFNFVNSYYKITHDGAFRGYVQSNSGEYTDFMMILLTL